MKTVRLTYDIPIRADMNDREAVKLAKAKLAAASASFQTEMTPIRVEIIDGPDDEPRPFTTTAMHMPATV